MNLHCDRGREVKRKGVKMRSFPNGVWTSPNFSSCPLLSSSCAEEAGPEHEESKASNAEVEEARRGLGDVQATDLRRTMTRAVEADDPQKFESMSKEVYR
jgi:hypothetical protein